MRIKALVVLCVVALGACDASAPEATYSVRDSAGVGIVESPVPSWREGDGWTVAKEPLLHIGVVEGAPEYQFSIVAGVFQEDGRIVVGDVQARQVRFYDLEGRYLGSFGRQGDGPGEFGTLGWVAPYRGDSLLTWDQRGRRLSVFTAEGSYARSMAAAPVVPPQPEGNEQVMWTLGGMSGPLEDGTVLGTPPIVFRGQLGELATGDWYVTRFSVEGDSLQSVGPFHQQVELTDFRQPVRLSRPYAPQTVFTARPSGILVAAGTTLEIRDIAFEGGLERIVRAGHLDLTLTESHRQAYFDSERTRLGPDVERGAIETALAEVRFPATIPATVQLLVDSEGCLWARHYSTRWTPGPETWSVFDPDGVLLGVVETPERLQVRQIGRDFLLGIWTDDLDVRYIRKYALER